MSASIPTICASCAELLVSPAITEPHTNMLLKHRHTQHSDRTHNGKYVCLECDSIWALHFEDDQLAQARLIEHKGTRSAYLGTACTQPHHTPYRHMPCRAMQRPRRIIRTL